MKADFKKGAQNVFDFTKHIIDEVGPRLPGSSEERAAHVLIAEDMEKATGNKVTVEPFKLAPIASIGAIPLLGFAGFIACAAYYLHPIASLVIASLTLLFAVIQVFLYKGWFDFIFPKAQSNNLYSIVEGKGKIDYTIVLSGHSDSSWNWNMAVKRPLMMIPKTVYGIVGVLVILGLSIVRIIVDNNVINADNGLNLAFLLIPIAFIPGLYFLTIYLSYDKKIASPGAMDNLTGIGLGMEVARYYHENPDELPDNCRIITAALGSEEAGLKGSLAFMKAHANDTELLINPYFINLDSFRDYDHFNVVEGDAWLGSHFDADLIQKSLSSMHEIGLDKAKVIKNPVGGCDSTPISRAGYKTVTLCAQNPIATDYYHTYRDHYDGLNINTLEKGYELLLNLADKIHAENAKKD